MYLLASCTQTLVLSKLANRSQSLRILPQKNVNMNRFDTAKYVYSTKRSEQNLGNHLDLSKVERRDNAITIMHKSQYVKYQMVLMAKWYLHSVVIPL